MPRIPLLLLVAASAVAGCADPIPDSPTWFADVQPIIMANCARCHGATPEVEQIEGFRLDRYVAMDPSYDAYDYREAIVAHAVDQIIPVMPPRGSLTDRQRTILERWVAAGAPKGVRDNRLPTSEVVSPSPLPAQVDQELALMLETLDADGDGLRVSLEVRDLDTGESWLLPSSIGAGLRDLTIDTGQLASGGQFALEATVDDGYSDDPIENQHVVILVPTIRIDHGARGTAPTVRMLEPNGGQAIIGETTIAWSAMDPDPGDTLTIDLELVQVAADGSGVVVASIARGLTGTSTYVWDPTGVPTEAGGVAIPYRVRVTATDAGALNTRFDESDASFTIAPPVGSTDLTWDDVKPTFLTYCRPCHGEPARTVAIDGFRFDKYDAADPEPPVNSDLGVYEMRANVYNRLVAQGSMPPANQPQPTAAQKAAIGEWILAGAPRGGGPTDAPPTWVWTTPNDSAVSRTTTGTIMLAWSTSDPEGLAVTGGIESAPLSAFADQTAFCDVPLTGWTAVAADVTAGSLSWTVPAAGYHCLRATVSDPAGNTTVRVARRPVRYQTTPGP